MAYMGGIHLGWPKIPGRMYSEAGARFAAILMFLGFNLTFCPQFLAGAEGMPRRYCRDPDEYALLNVLSSAGAVLLAASYLLPVGYLLWSMRFGERAGADPWGAKGLEWETSSPPPPHNFDRPPVVTDGPYAYPHP